MYASRITADQLQPLLRHGWCYGDVLIIQDALDCCQREDDLYAALEHHMDLITYLCEIGKATKTSSSVFIKDGKPVKTAFVLETGVLNVTTDPTKGVTVVRGPDDLSDLD